MCVALLKLCYLSGSNALLAGLADCQASCLCPSACLALQLAALAGLSRLQSLMLLNMHLHSSALAPLAGLPGLEGLQLELNGNIHASLSLLTQLQQLLVAELPCATAGCIRRRCCNGAGTAGTHSAERLPRSLLS